VLGVQNQHCKRRKKIILRVGADIVLGLKHRPQPLKGTVAQGFALCFFISIKPTGPLIHILKFLKIQFQIRRYI
jgi:hypothetical protein